METNLKLLELLIEWTQSERFKNEIEVMNIKMEKQLEGFTHMELVKINTDTYTDPKLIFAAHAINVGTKNSQNLRTYEIEMFSYHTLIRAKRYQPE